MAKRKVRIGIIGIGGIGRFHANFIKGDPNAELAAIYDSNAKLLADAKTSYPEARICDSFEEFLKTPGLKAVVVATPNNVHARYSIEAANRGLHVLCEKPLAMNKMEAKKMVDTVQKNKVVGMTNFSYRWVPSFRYMRDLVRKGDFGKINRVHVKYLQSWLRDPNGPIVWRNLKEFAGFGALGDLGSHMIDAVCFITGAKPKRVVGVHGIHVKTKLNPATGKRAKVTTDTNAQFMVDFGTFVAIFETSQVEPGHGNHLVVSMGGEKGSCRLYSEDSKGFELYLDPTGGATGWATSMPHVENPKDLVVGGPCAHDFVKAINGKLKDYPSFRDGYAVQEVLDAILKSAKTEKWEKL